MTPRRRIEGAHDRPFASPGFLTEWGYAESLLIDGRKLICYPGGTKGYMVALEKTRGEVIWANTDINQPASYSSPILVEDQGVRQIIVMVRFAVIGVDADSGKLLWQHEHINRHKENAETPLYKDGVVYVSSGYGYGAEALKLRYGEEGIEVNRLWFNANADSEHGGLILLDGHIYGSAYKLNHWFCLDAVTGETTYLTDGIGRGFSTKGSITYADGMLYCLGKRGTMALVKPTPDEYRINRTLCFAHPVVCNGTLYVRRGDHLYAYDIRSQ